MTQAHKTPGNFVKVKQDYINNPLYSPYFSVYQNHVFEIMDIPYHGHVMMKCVTGLLDKNQKPLIITLHDEEIQTVKFKKNKN